MPTAPHFDFRRTPVTLIVIAVAAALEIAFSFQNDNAMRVDFYNQWLGILPSIWQGQLWRPFTSCLMHIDLLHMLFNCYWLLIFGSEIEVRFGSWRMLSLIVLLGYVSMLPEYVIGSYFDAEPAMIAGLSGIVYGLFGLVLIGRRYVPDWRPICDQTTVYVMIGWFFLCIFLTWTQIMMIANWAHGAGFGFGMLYGQAIFGRAHRPAWLALSIILSVIVLATLLGCPGHAQYEAVMHGR